MENEEPKKSTSIKSIYKIIRWPIRIYLMICLIVYFAQDYLIFFPQKAIYIPIENADKISFENDDETLNGWLVNKHLAHQKLIIYYGGNAADVYSSISEAKKRNAAVLLVNYRGYGESTGSPSQKKLFLDAQYILNTMHEKYHPAIIIIHGRSLGTGIATYIASRNKVEGLILTTPYDSIKNIGKEQYPFLPIGAIINNPFDSTKYVGKITCPTLLFYTPNDKVISNERTENLLQFFKKQPFIVEITEASHNNIVNTQKYEDAVQGFVNKIVLGHTWKKNK